MFEGRTVTGVPVVTVANGKVVYDRGDLRAERGAGRYLKRRAFAPMFDALRRQAAQRAPRAVDRAS